MAVVFTDLNVEWNHGTARRSANPEPLIHVRRCDERASILRQSKAVTADKYRLLGRGLLHQATSVLR